MDEISNNYFCNSRLLFPYLQIANRKLQIMGKQQGMRPQDVVILLKRITPSGMNMNGKQLSESLGISASEVSESMDRNRIAGLVDKSKSIVNTLALADFLTYGIRYCFPVEIGGIVRGVPTAVSASPFSEIIVSGNEAYVWPFPEGSGRGQAIEPLYRSVPEAALKDADFYKLLVITDILRMGRVREREIAIEELNKYLEQYARQQRKN